MTDLRKAAEMALNYFESAYELDSHEIEIREALRQALAQHVDAINMTQERVDETAKREHKPYGYVWTSLRDGMEVRFSRMPPNKFYNPQDIKPVYTAPPSLEVAVLAERKSIVNLFMIQHEAAKGAHNYWQVAANLVQADQGLNSGD